MSERPAAADPSWTLRHPILVVILTTFAVAVIGSGGRFLQFSNDIRVFFSKENPQLKDYEALEQTYSTSKSVLFVITPADGSVFSRQTLASVHRLTEAAWQIPYSRRVDSITNFQHSYAVGDDVVVEDLVSDPLSLTDAALARIRRIALGEPHLVGRLISTKGHVTGINVPVNLPGEDPLQELPDVAQFARRLAAEAEADNPNLSVGLTGLVMIDNALSEAGLHDMKTLMPLMFFVVIIALGLLLRTAAGVLGTVLVIVFSIVSAMGMAGWLGIVLSPPVVSAPVIILTLAIADCVHLLEAFTHGLRRGLHKWNAMEESLRINIQPVGLTSLTTAIGFFSLNTSDSPPFRDLGNIVAIGVLSAWILSVFFLPALMILLPVRPPPREAKRHLWVGPLGQWVLGHHRRLLWTMGTLILVLTVLIPRNELNDEFLKYFDEKIPFRKATDFAIANLTGFEFIEYSMDSGEPGGISRPDYLKRVERFAEWLRRQPSVRHVYSFTDIMKRLNQTMHGDDPDRYRLPEDRESAAQYLLLYQLSLPYGLDLNDQINIDQSATLLRASLGNVTSNEILDLERKAMSWLKAHVPPPMQRNGSSQSVMFAHIGERNIRSLLAGTILALILVSVLLIFAFRSLKFGLISLIPNLAPAAIAYGLWGLTVGRVGVALSVVVGMTMGIVVDDTIHFMSKYLKARREGGRGPEEAVRYAYDHVGRAMWATSLILIAGFSVLMFSDFELNSGMGFLSAVTIAAALVADFFFLPPLLIRMEE